MPSNSSNLHRTKNERSDLPQLYEQLPIWKGLLFSSPENDNDKRGFLTISRTGNDKYLGQIHSKDYQTASIPPNIEPNEWFPSMILTFLILKSKNNTSFFKKSHILRTPQSLWAFDHGPRLGLSLSTKSRASGPTKKPGLQAGGQRQSVSLWGLRGKGRGTFTF